MDKDIGNSNCTKMEEIYARFKKWIELIQEDKIECIAEDLRATVAQKPDARLNRTIFKMLLYLSHAAERCDSLDTERAKEIFNLTNAICSALVDIPDLKKYFLSLIHVARRLISMHLYAEARAVCDRLLPGELFNEDYLECSDLYLKMADLWHGAATRLLKLPPDDFTERSYSSFLRLLDCELRILRLVSEKHAKHLLARLHFYLSKIGPLVKNLNENCAQHFRDFVVDHLKLTKLSAKGHRRFEVYGGILMLMSRVAVDEIAKKRMESAADEFARFSGLFEASVSADAECSRCFGLFVGLCSTLLRPVASLPKNLDEIIEKHLIELSKAVAEFGHLNAVRWNTLMASQILDALCSRWDDRLKAGEFAVFTLSFLRAIVLLVRRLSSLFAVQRAEVNGSCRADDCAVRTDLYNATVLQMRCVGLLCRITDDARLRSILPDATELLETSLRSISLMRESGCEAWSCLWSSCGLHLYNLAVSCHKSFGEESATLLSLLCSCIVRFEGIDAAKSHLRIDGPMCRALHRLSSVYYANGKYREAMTASAFNGLLSCDRSESSAFRMWANIKHKNSADRGIMEMTMLGCLRADRAAIAETGVDVSLIERDHRELCLRELSGLREARCDLSLAMRATLEELESLNPGALRYARGVQLLCHHSLNFEWNEWLTRCVRKAASWLRREGDSSTARNCLSANLSFYKFVARLRAIGKSTTEEMESAMFPLRAQKLSAGRARDSTDGVAPAYSMINVAEDAKLFGCLQQALKEWSACIERDVTAVVKGWEPQLTLRSLMITGEYCRLHEFPTCEIHAWTLAYRLAYELEDYPACIYVVGRSVSLRQINDQWIDAANGFAEKLRNSSDSETIETIAMFWLSLSDFYFETGKYEEATKLFEEATSLPGIGPQQNLATYLLSVDMTLHNYKLRLNGWQDKRYAVNIVKCLYSILSLKEHLQVPKWGFKEKQLYSCDVLLTSTSHLSLRMNSQLSFKEISSHLVHRLKMAQKLGLTLRVAECLKSLCFIDLSRLRLDDCEVKLQGLERILGTETFQQSRDAKLDSFPSLLPRAASPGRAVDPIRDVQRNDASPVLRKQVFVEPDFLRHEKNCGCYRCKNPSYQHLVCAGAHIRAQLYALQEDRRKALQHFRGCFRIQQRVLRTRCSLELSEVPERERKLMKQHPWRQYYNAVDYVLFLVDFSRFVKPLLLPNREELKIALEALRICRVYSLESHPIYAAVNELIIEYRFQDLMRNSRSFEKFTVPDASSINIENFVHADALVDASLCVTPTSGPRNKKPIAVRRNKTPPLLKLTKISMDLSDDEDDASTPKASASRIGRISRPLRRKISLEEYAESSPVIAKNKLTPFVAFSSEFFKNTKADEEKSTLRLAINRAASMVPDLSQSLCKIGEADELEKPASSETIAEVIKTMEDFKISRALDDKTSRQQNRKKSTAKDRLQRKKAEVPSNLESGNDVEKIDEMIGLFRGMLIASKSCKPTSDRIGESNADSRSSSSSSRANSTEPQKSVPGKEYSCEDRRVPSASSDAPEIRIDFAAASKPAGRTYAKRRKPAQILASKNGADDENTSKSTERSETCDNPCLEFKANEVEETTEHKKSSGAKNDKSKKTTKDSIVDGPQGGNNERTDETTLKAVPIVKSQNSRARRKLWTSEEKVDQTQKESMSSDCAENSPSEIAERSVNALALHSEAAESVSAGDQKKRGTSRLDQLSAKTRSKSSEIDEAIDKIDDTQCKSNASDGQQNPKNVVEMKKCQARPVKQTGGTLKSRNGSLKNSSELIPAEKEGEMKKRQTRPAKKISNILMSRNDNSKNSDKVIPLENEEEIEKRQTGPAKRTSNASKSRNDNLENSSELIPAENEGEMKKCQTRPAKKISNTLKSRNDNSKNSNKVIPLENEEEIEKHQTGPAKRTSNASKSRNDNLENSSEVMALENVEETKKRQTRPIKRTSNASKSGNDNVENSSEVMALENGEETKKRQTRPVRQTGNTSKSGSHNVEYPSKISPKNDKEIRKRQTRPARKTGSTSKPRNEDSNLVPSSENEEEIERRRVKSVRSKLH